MTRERLLVAGWVIGAACVGWACKRPTPNADSFVAGGKGLDTSADARRRGDANEVLPAQSALTLEWLPDDGGIAVGDRWVLRPERKRYDQTSCTDPDAAGRSGCASQLLSTMAIPVWLGRRVMAGRTDDVINTGFRLSGQLLFVQQFDRRAELPPVCRVCAMDSASADSGKSPACRWRRPAGGCLDPELSYLTRVDRGPRGLLALHSEAEGHFALSVVRYDPGKGQASVGVPAIKLEGASLVSVRFAPDGSAVDLISPCELRPTAGGHTPPCDDVDARTSWRLYSRPIGPGSLTLRRADLPPGAVLHPREEIFAWPRGASVCVGDPHGPPPPCFPLPAR